MGKRSSQVESFAFRAKVRQMLAEGFSVSAIAKATGKSYRHTKRIADQENGGLGTREASEMAANRRSNWTPSSLRPVIYEDVRMDTKELRWRLAQALRELRAHNPAVARAVMRREKGVEL